MSSKVMSLKRRIKNYAKSNFIKIREKPTCIEWRDL